MVYTLKLFDKNLLQFEVVQNLADPVVSITWIDEKNRNLLPLGMEITDTGLARWLKHRSIPKNRAYVNLFLAKCGMSINRPIDIITKCKGLSLNDSYWIVDENYKNSFDKVNLYENRFSNALAWLAFTGYGSSIRSTFASSPEFTTNGMLPKCWRRIDGKVYLYKGGTSGASNTGNEPYSELYSYHIGKIMGIHVIPYKISRWKGKLCSVCELFSSKDISYVPIGRIIKSGGMPAVRDFYQSLGAEYIRSLNEMFVFDAIICNTDRHFGNFGLLIDSHTNKIIGPAPLFDHGNALFNLAGEENWQSEKLLQEYADTLLPCVYDDFFENAKSVMNSELREKVRRLLNFKIPKTGRYNYPKKKMDLMERQIQKRAARLLQ